MRFKAPFLKLLTRLWFAGLVTALALLLSPERAFPQGGLYQTIALSRAGQPLAGSSFAVCQGVNTSAASLTTNVVTLTLVSNPITAGFLLGGTIYISNFQGTDAFFNGTYTITNITSTQLQYSLVHANGSATSAGAVIQQGKDSLTACLPLINIYSDIFETLPLTNPGIADSFGNVQFAAPPGLYQVQYYGSGITTRIYPAQIPTTISSGPGIQFLSSNTNTAVNAAIQALPAGLGGTIYLPSGQITGTQTIIIDRPVKLIGQSSGFNNRGTLFNYSGSGILFQVSSGGTGLATGSIFYGFSITNTGTGTIGFDVDVSMTGLYFDHIYDAANVQWSTAVIRIGNALTGAADSFISIANSNIYQEKIGVQALRVIQLRITDTDIINSTTGDLQLGDATHKVYAIECNKCGFGGNPNQPYGVQINNVDQATFEASVFENDGSGYAIDIPPGVIQASSISVTGSRFAIAGFNVPGQINRVSSASGSVQFSISDSFVDSGYAASTPIVSNGLSAGGGLVRISNVHAANGNVLGPNGLATTIEVTANVLAGSLQSAASPTPIAIAGATSGATTLTAPATGGGTQTFPAGNGTVSNTIATGTAAMPATLIGTQLCGSAQTVSSANVLAGDVVSVSYAAAIPNAKDGLLNIVAYATSGVINIQYCNGTAAAITPDALTLAWTVKR